MSAYVVAKVNIHDREAYKKYEAGFMDAFTPFGGRILGLDEDVAVLEGKWPVTRTVILEFESVEQAKKWHASDAYQAVAQHRYAASDADMVVVRSFPAS